MSSTSGPRQATRVLLFVVITVVALAVLVGGLLVVGYVLLANPFCAKPPTQQERRQQEAFVLAHLPDARGFEWTVADCDDNGQASVDFTTRQRGSSASEAFLSDPACKASKEPDASPGDVTCTSGDFKVSVYLEDEGAIDTTGELASAFHAGMTTRAGRSTEVPVWCGKLGLVDGPRARTRGHFRGEA